ncbi:MAG: imidazole glycerol phosphate synthase subunit HisF [Actinobacteria bacterium]|nr:imidazole glycerol phosphate synthase subunit HisF [Actinomycetota bacterium]
MINIRIIPKLEVKGPNLIKGIHLEGLRIVGKPEEAALKYYQEGADEIIYIDLVASLYRRKYLLDIISKTADKVFIPLTVGGGIRSIEDMKTLFRAGADKIAMNTGAFLSPKIITQASHIFGSQCVVVSIEAQRKGDKWEAYTDSGRSPTKKDVVSWAKEVEKLGAGEILVTSINQDGTFQGFDNYLIKAISRNVKIPVIASGGAGSLKDFYNVVKEGKADAISASAAFHFNKVKISEVKKYLISKNINVRYP